jgi:hypothetical protein
MKKYWISIKVIPHEIDPGVFCFQMETLNGGMAYNGPRERIEESLSPASLNEMIRNDYGHNNPFEDISDYPCIEIDDCGRQYSHSIPENEKWRSKETAQEFKTGEIVGCYQFDCEQDADVLQKCVIRFKRHNKYYVKFLHTRQGMEYLGFPDEWLDPDEVVRLEGEIISRVNFCRAEDMSGNDIKNEAGWEISQIASIEKSTKSCRKEGARQECLEGKCECILPDYLVTFKDNSQIKMFGFDTRFISEIARIPLKNPMDPQLNLFAFV